MTNEFMGHRPLFAPLHSRDLMSAQNTVHTPRIQMIMKVLNSWTLQTSLVLNQVMIHFSPIKSCSPSMLHNLCTMANSVHISSISSFIGFDSLTTGKALYGKHQTKRKSLILNTKLVNAIEKENKILAKTII